MTCTISTYKPPKNGAEYGTSLFILLMILLILIWNKKYKCLDLKISKLVSTQKEKPNDKTYFYPRVVNNMDIFFTNEEIVLMNKDKNVTLIKKANTG